MVKMSWFNASHLSTFAKQALTTAQKSIDRVLDIKEESQWSDKTLMPYEGRFLQNGRVASHVSSVFKCTFLFIRCDIA